MTKWDTQLMVLIGGTWYGYNRCDSWEDVEEVLAEYSALYGRKALENSDVEVVRVLTHDILSVARANLELVIVDGALNLGELYVEDIAPEEYYVKDLNCSYSSLDDMVEAIRDAVKEGRISATDVPNLEIIQKTDASAYFEDAEQEYPSVRLNFDGDGASIYESQYKQPLADALLDNLVGQPMQLLERPLEDLSLDELMVQHMQLLERLRPLTKELDRRNNMSTVKTVGTNPVIF